MKRVLAACVAVVMLCAAIAQAQSTGTGNSYTVTGKATPSKVGTKKKPKPLSLFFGYDVAGENGQRPSPVKQYKIFLSNSRVNTKAAPVCKTADQGPDDCPAKTIVGTGYIRNATGATADPNDRRVKCNAKLWVINKGGMKGVIYVRGTPSATDERERCDIELGAPIQASWKNSSKGSTLTFDVPPTLLHPLPPLSNAVEHVESRIKKISKKIGGKRRGFYESVGCKGGKFTVRVTFTPESGPVKTAQDTQPCKK